MRITASTSTRADAQARPAQAQADRLRRDANPVEARPTYEFGRETYEKYQERLEKWKVDTRPIPGVGEPAPPTDPPAPTAAEIATDVLLGVVGGYPGVGKMPTPRPGATLPRPSSAPPRVSQPRPPRPGSAPPPGRSSTPPSEAAATAAKRPGTPAPGEAPTPKRPTMPGDIAPDTVSPTEAGPSTSRASPTKGTAPASPKLEIQPTVASHEMQAVLKPEQWSSPGEAFTQEAPEDPDAQIYRTSYENAFRQLTPVERYVLRDWTHVEGVEGRYVDEIGGRQVNDDSEYQGINYELNAYLRNSAASPDPLLEGTAARLHNALSKLPNVPMDRLPLLRVSDVPADYASHIAQGDLVTNGRSFMSASSDRGYAAESLEQGYAAEGRTGAMAIYEFQANSAVPTLPGITTLAGHEAEWLFMPNRVFKVEEVATTRINTQSAADLPLIGVRLTETSVLEPTVAANLHTAEPTWISAADRRPPPLPNEHVPLTRAGGDSGSSDYYYYSTSGSD